MATVIGITTNGTNDKWVQSPYYDGYYVVPDLYVAAVRRAGGIPVLLPPGEPQIEQLLEIVDGIIVSGGGDIRPELYGGDATHENLTRQDAERDAFEIDLIQCAMQDQDKPVLCVCRGMQVLNVALGGTMYEHIPDIRENDMHRGADGYWALHDIHVVKASKLAQAMKADVVQTYSGHHQAIKSTGDGLAVVAKSPDDIIEGLEVISHPWMVGVQWHPEKSAADDSTQQALFDKLVEIASVRIKATNRRDAIDD